MTTNSPEQSIRLATMADLDAVSQCVQHAYAMYVPRMGMQPAPMLADYAALIRTGMVYVLPGEPGADIQATLVIELHDDHLFVENVAVHPHHQGRGLGKTMLQFAEEQAAANGLPEIRLYTHELMTENLTFYPHLGYEEVERRTQDGYSRVFMRKPIGTITS